MGKTKSSLTVFFEEPFWVGIFEKIEDGKLFAAKVTFGAEPRDGEVFDFVLKNYDKLNFGPAVESREEVERRKNAKRVRREAKKQLASVGVGTKSQNALKLQREKFKTEKKILGRERKKAEEKERFELKQRKKKEKKKGH